MFGLIKHVWSYREWIIAGFRILLELGHLINVGICVQCLIWIALLEEKLAQENCDILKFLDIKNDDYSSLLLCVKLALAYHSIMVVLKFATTCLILGEMFWRKYKCQVYNIIARMIFRKYQLLPTTYATVNQHNATLNQAAVNQHHATLNQAVIVNQYAANVNPAQSTLNQAAVNQHDAPLNQAVTVNQDAANVNPADANRNNKLTSLRQIDSVVQRVLERENTSSRDDLVVQYEEQNTDQEGDILQDVFVQRENKEHMSFDEGEISDDEGETLQDVLVQRENKEDRSLAEGENTTDDSNRRYPLRNRTESTRYPDSIYQKEKP